MSPTKRAPAALVCALMLSACAGGLSPPTPFGETVEQPSSTTVPLPTLTTQPSPTATQTEPPEASPQVTGPAIARLSPGTLVEIRSIQMIDATGGWALGRAGGSDDHVLRTGDGGLTWRDLTPPRPAALPTARGADSAFFFLDNRTGWVADLVDRGETLPIEIDLWHTSDGGQTWELGGRVDPTDYPEAVPILEFTNDTSGWLLLQHFIGMGHHGLTLLRTIDAGDGWERLASMPESETTCVRTGLSFADTANGWMTGECPFEPGSAMLEVSEDGGTAWQALTLPPPAQAPDLFQTALSCSTRSPHRFRPEAGVLVVTCSTEGASGTEERSFLYTTSDDGASWSTAAFPGGELYLLDPRRGWALSTDLHWTEDGGATWTKVKTVAWEGQFSFVNPQLGWAVAHTEQEIALVRTADGGRTWELLEPVISP